MRHSKLKALSIWFLLNLPVYSSHISSKRNSCFILRFLRAKGGLAQTSWKSESLRHLQLQLPWESFHFAWSFSTDSKLTVYFCGSCCRKRLSLDCLLGIKPHLKSPPSSNLRLIDRQFLKNLRGNYPNLKNLRYSTADYPSWNVQSNTIRCTALNRQVSCTSQVQSAETWAVHPQSSSDI